MVKYKLWGGVFQLQFDLVAFATNVEPASLPGCILKPA